MAPGDGEVPFGDLNIGGQVVSTFHGRPHKTTHFNTIRAQHRAHTGNTSKPYITTSRNRIHQMRNTGNIIPLQKGHMRLSPQARKTMNLVLSNPELTNRQRAKCVNALAGVLTSRKITRDRSVLEVAATVTKSTLSSRSPRVSRSLRENQNVPQEPAVGLPTLDNRSAGLLPEVANNGPDGTMEEPPVPDALPLEKPGPSQQLQTRRAVTRHGTEIFCGLPTPGNSPTKAPGDQRMSIVIERDVEMGDMLIADHDPLYTPPSSGSPTPQRSEPQFGMAPTEDESASLRRENAALLEVNQYVLRKLSRNGQGTLSNIETVVNRAVRQRDELRVENQDLRARIELLESGITDLQDQIARTWERLNRAEIERIEIAQSKRRWIVRMWALAGRAPGELHKKDAEIDNMREKLASLHARLAQGQSQLRELQGQLGEEREKRMGAEAELDSSRVAHAQEIKDRDLAGLRLRDQLKQVVNNLDSGAILI